jgi:hypothetical protein
VERDREPVLTDFKCTTCGAQPGEECRSDQVNKRTNGHARRQDKLIRALQDWQVRETDRKVSG